MRVAVLGSWHDKPKWPLRETPEAFAAACRSLGRALASCGHSLIVGSDGEHTADFHATLGALDVIKEAGRPPESPRVLVVRAARSSAAGAFDSLRRSDPGVFIEQPCRRIRVVFEALAQGLASGN